MKYVQLERRCNVNVFFFLQRGPKHHRAAKAFFIGDRQNITSSS